MYRLLHWKPAFRQVQAKPQIEITFTLDIDIRYQQPSSELPSEVNEIWFVVFRSLTSHLYQPGASELNTELDEKSPLVQAKRRRVFLRKGWFFMELQNSISPSGMLRAPEVASILNISRSHAYRLIRDGRIPSIRMGRAVRVRKVDLDQFLRNVLSTNQEWDSLSDFHTNEPSK